MIISDPVTVHVSIIAFCERPSSTRRNIDVITNDYNDLLLAPRGSGES